MNDGDIDDRLIDYWLDSLEQFPRDKSPMRNVDLEDEQGDEIRLLF